MGVLLAACLTRKGIAVIRSDGEYGVDVINPDPNNEAATRDTVSGCQARAAATEADHRPDAAAAGSCLRPPSATPAVVDCLRRTFTERTRGVAPVPLWLYLGVRSGTVTPPSTRRTLAVAGLVALVAFAVAALLSRRVLRPIGRLTAAAQRFGDGDLGARVPVAGGDELAALSRSFNRMADSLQRAEERQRRLVADVAHELRAPLANLRGYLEALQDGVLAPDAELFALLHEEAVLQQRIVDDLQELALAEAGALAYHRSEVETAELLETCRTAYLAVAEAAGVHLVVTGSGPLWVHADPDRLRQVLGNLISNALRATPAGGAITLSARGWESTVVLRVADTGTGIAPEALPYIFDRFWRADSARGRSTGGSGLGLAIAAQIVTDHGGVITVDSFPGTGTAFTITLPATDGIPR